MKKTLLVGNFGAKNIGDELILDVALKAYPESVIMTAAPEWTRDFCENPFETVLFPPTAFRSWWKFVTSSAYRRQLFGLKDRVDKVVFVGGGLFAIKLRACILWFQVFIWLKFLLGKNIPVIMEYQGIDEKLGFISKKLARYVFERVDHVSVRDEASARAIKAFGILDYGLKEDRVFEAFKDNEIADKNSKLIVFNALSFLDLDHWEKIFSNLDGFDCVFLVCQPSDRNFVPEIFPGEIIEPKNKTELFQLLKRADFMVAERLHAIILGACFCGVQKTFTLKSPYSEKVKSFCEKEGIKVYPRCCLKYS